MSVKPHTTGLTVSQLEKLCQAEQIEHTMHLLFTLNHWAKARDRLFYVDRQGLYSVKGALLRQAYTMGTIEARTYIDGIEGFGAELSFDSTAEITAESIMWRLEEVAELAHPDRYDESDRTVRQFYAAMTGKATFTGEDLNRLENTQLQEYILNQLRDLERQARSTRQPIPVKKLMELCIAPCDLLCIRDQRYYKLGDWSSWDQLDSGDLRKLDPEGLSLIAFHYTSAVSRYIFHIPLRLAEEFVPTEHLHRLRRTPTASREQGEMYGRAITEAESLQHPIAEILRELEVDIVAICPRLLSDKQEFVLAQAMRHTSWNDDEDEEELDEAFWQDMLLSNQKHAHPSGTGKQEPEACPLCNQMISPVSSTTRLEHWQQEHTGQDLTFSQVSWLLNCEVGKELLCQLYPPDYRAPHEKGYGTRYWRVETLARLQQEKEVSET